LQTCDSSLRFFLIDIVSFWKAESSGVGVFHYYSSIKEGKQIQSQTGGRNVCIKTVGVTLLSGNCLMPEADFGRTSVTVYPKTSSSLALNYNKAYQNFRPVENSPKASHIHAPYINDLIAREPDPSLTTPREHPPYSPRALRSVPFLYSQFHLIQTKSLFVYALDPIPTNFLPQSRPH
jgi:hypothetical protein